MITTEQAIQIHEVLIERFGGSKGLRDNGLLESALLRPFHTYDGIELHENDFIKAAALIEGILINHPFVDGNKRIGYVLMRLFLLENGIEINASQDEKYQFVIDIASGKLRLIEIQTWIQNNSK
jgi:death on curing protein